MPFTISAAYLQGHWGEGGHVCPRAPPLGSMPIACACSQYVLKSFISKTLLLLGHGHVRTMYPMKQVGCITRYWSLCDIYSPGSPPSVWNHLEISSYLMILPLQGCGETCFHILQGATSESNITVGHQTKSDHNYHCLHTQCIRLIKWWVQKN